jgi:hypothetical protein
VDVVADGVANVGGDGVAEVDVDGAPGIAADVVTGVTADEVPGVVADEAPGLAADEMPGVASVDVWLNPLCVLCPRQKLENGFMATGKNPTTAVMVERMRMVLPALVCHQRHSWDWAMLGQETRHSEDNGMANLIPR